MSTQITYRNLDTLPQYAALQKYAAEPRAQLMSGDIPRCDLPFVDGLRYNYAGRLLRQQELITLCDMAQEAQLAAKYRALTNGEYLNRSEKRMVLHHLLRGSLHETQHDEPGGTNTIANAITSTITNTITSREGKGMADFYEGEKQRVCRFAADVRNGVVRTNDGRRFEAVVQIGIGGSELGPRALYEAMKGWGVETGVSPLIPAYFISNVDPDDALSVLHRVPARSTLCIIVSKSGSTIETLTNAALVKRFLQAHGVSDAKKHMVVVTAEGSPLAQDADYLQHFFIDDHIGGRYSSSGAVGGVLLSIACGPEAFQEFLAGAHQADRSAQQPDPLRNPVLLDALCGVYERTFLGHPAYAVLPYSQALHRFPSHIQQLDMESNGKSANGFGAPIPYQSGAVVFGEPGTNGQHSFYQLLHQGTVVVPAIFIAFEHAQGTGEKEGVSAQCLQAQRILRANVIAQITALARGEENPDHNKHFAGGRPSALLYGQRLTPFVLGALLSFFENRVLFQGFLWNVNSFDQPGVQLGKRLADTMIGGGDGDGARGGDGDLGGDDDDGTRAPAGDPVGDPAGDPILQQYQRLFSR